MYVSRNAPLALGDCPENNKLVCKIYVYVYIYKHSYIYMHIQIYTHTCTYLRLNIHMYIYFHIYLYIYTEECITLCNTPYTPHISLYVTRNTHLIYHCM